MINNGKSKLIFFLASGLFTLIVVIAIPTMANQMIVNDRLSRDRDNELKEDTSFLKDELHKQQLEIIDRLARIESKIESKDD